MPPPMTTAPAAPAAPTLSTRARCLGIARAPPIDGFRQKGREVDDLQLRAGRAHPVVEHYGAEGARDRQRFGSGAGRLTYALLVDGPAAPFLHEHARASGAAAEGALAIARHLHRPACRRRQLARRLANVVVPREIAGVVVGDRPFAGERLQLALAHETGQELGVMHHLVQPADVRVLVADRVEAVRAGGDDLRHPGLVQRADVLLGQLLKRVLVTHAPRGVAGARLARPQVAKSTPASLSSFAVDLAPC